MSSNTARFGLVLAPGGLRLAQELVNTALDELQGTEDQLADPAAANNWLRDALTRWADATGKPVPDLWLSEADLPPLRRLREQLRQATRAQAEHVHPPATAPAELVPVDIRLQLEPDGHVGYRPVERGWEGVAALVSMELLLAHSNGTLPRLKSCAGTRCGVSFYDESRNQARVWHDSKVCGNAPNLRASRTRRKNQQ
ncbi:CGNR zinc finger domain-containing protein [Kribbella sp. VKM Ac-2566]|uniref:CGNR zinc finger domain-containing protein n=1 Tax=Kribbella sp. VKM Ac-2566 TaxID=2512218 RepID=UPI00106422FB|nr:CGNR zinc finger domain-containing protein [Kribbella sp. VKM Ac-2566]TDX03558.1 putative RNA-binding Zn ribbon-like protein [Kribbella sp. VKM Ac-2566]